VKYFLAVSVGLVWLLFLSSIEVQRLRGQNETIRMEVVKSPAKPLFSNFIYPSFFALRKRIF
jgi:hypothetical protein